MQWRLASEPDWSNADSDETAGIETSYTLQGLTPDTGYLVRVRAASELATGDWSREKELNTAAAETRNGGDGGGGGDDVSDRAVLPPAPTGIDVRPTSDTTVRVTWDAPQATAVAITGYNVRWRTGSDAWSQETGLAPGTESFDIRGLSAGTTYEVQVQAVAGAVTSEWSPAPTPVATTVPTGILPEVRIRYDGDLIVGQSSTDFLVFRVQATAPVTSDLVVDLTVIVDGAMVTAPEDETVTIRAAHSLSNELRVDVDPDATATADGSVWVALNPDPTAYAPATPTNVSVLIAHQR